jgi:cell division protein FtsN
MKPRYYNRIPFDIFSGKVMLIILLFIVSSLSFVLGYYVGKNSGAGETIVTDRSYQISGEQEKTATVTPFEIESKKESVEDNIEQQKIDKDSVRGARKEGSEKTELKKQTVKKAVQHKPSSEVKSRQSAISRIYYSIQVGAFKSKAQAETVKKRLQKKGYHVSISESTTGKTLYKVRVGRFKNREEAMVFLRKIKDREKLNGIIVRSKG